MDGERIASKIVPLLIKRAGHFLENPKDSLDKNLNERFTKGLLDNLKKLDAIFHELKKYEGVLVQALQSIEEDLIDPTRFVRRHFRIQYTLQKSEFLTKMLSPLKSDFCELKLLLTSERKMPEIVSWKQPSISLDAKESTDDPGMSEDRSRAQQSYDLLHSSTAKKCALFLAVFPERTVIKKKPLIYWWIAEGLINTESSEKTEEEVGDCIFNELIEKGLAEPHRRSKKSPLIVCCLLMPWVRRMLISKAREAKLFDINGEGEITNNYNESHRLIMYNKRIPPNSANPNPKDKLSTIYNVSESLISHKDNYFSKNNKLEVLQLGRWQSSPDHHIEVEKDEFLDKALKNQKQLRYVSLRGISRITSLPQSILQSQDTLEILDLKACHNLETLPPDFGSFRKLTHLDISECYLLNSLPQGLEELSHSLQVLKGFTINHWRKNPCRLEALRKFQKLRKLSVIMGIKYPDQKEEASAAAAYGDNILEKLKKMLKITRERTRGTSLAKEPDTTAPNDITLNNLKVLTITWQHSSTLEFGVDRTAPLFARLKLPSLEKLDLRCYPSYGLPKWISPNNFDKLNKLYVKGGRLWSLTLAKWETIKILRLNYFRNMALASHWLKGFPNLEFFECINVAIRAGEYQKFPFEWRKEEGRDELESQFFKFITNL